MLAGHASDRSGRRGRCGRDRGSRPRHRRVDRSRGRLPPGPRAETVRRWFRRALSRVSQLRAAAVVATYFSSFAASVCSVPHCICNSVPDLLTWFEMVDLAALTVPRPLIIEAGVRDPIFPVNATRESYDALVALCSGAGADPP